MATFKLTPVAERLGDPAWEKSERPHEACYVGAPDEREARLRAFAHFMGEVVAPGSHPDLRPKDSPWGNAELTHCTELLNFADHIPDGWVYRESEYLKRK